MSKRKSIKTIVIHTTVDQTKLPNKMHFEAQLHEKSHKFVDRKKRAKNGYRKYKKDYE